MFQALTRHRDVTKTIPALSRSKERNTFERRRRNWAGISPLLPRLAARSLSGAAPANKRMKLTGAAILVSRGMKFLQAAPAAYPYRSTAERRIMADEEIV